MQDNPYTKLIGIMREEGKVFNPPSFVLGTVVKPLPNLVIDIGEIELETDDVLVSDLLVTGLTVHDGTQSEEIIYKPLQLGDKVILFPDKEKDVYIIMSRVVSV
jgi:hypothetical protein